MKGAIAPLATTPAFVAFLSGLENPVVTVLFGVAFTALLQSSSSSTVIFQAFAMEGIISYYTAAYLCIGAAIGSVTPNLLAGLTANRNGKRTAVLNLIFNLFRAAIIMTLITLVPQVLEFIRSLSPGNVGRQIANTHTFFALFSVILMLPFTNFMVKLSQKLLPLKADENKAVEERKLVYMTQPGSVSPAAALNLARKEAARMGRIAGDNLRLAVSCFFEPSDEKAQLVEETEDTVNYLEHAILSKLVELRTPDMHQKDLELVYRLTLTVSDMERLSDHAENVIEYAQMIHSGKAVISADAMKELHNMAELALRSVDLCLEIFETGDYSRLTEAEALEAKVDDARERLTQSHIRRLMNSACEPRGGVVFSDLITDLERCSDHAINIATSLHTDTV